MESNNKKPKFKFGSEEYRKMMSEKLKGREFSDEHRAKIAEANRQRGGHSEATKEKIRRAKLGKPTGRPAPNKKEHININGIMHKSCSVCKEAKPLTEFHKNANARWDGLNYKCKVCACAKRKDDYHTNHKYREYAKEQSRENHRQIKRQSIIYLGGRCLGCRLVFVENYNENLFEFHHRDPNEKDFTITEMRSRVFENIKNELDKCDLLCANCHRMVHQEQWKNGRSKKGSN